VSTTKKTTAVAIKAEDLPGKLGEMMSMATVLAKSGIVPAAYAGKPEAIFAVIQYGKEFGIPAMSALQNMAFINGKPSMGTDLLAALAHRHKEWAGYEVKEYSDDRCVVEITRLVKGKEKKFKGSFSMDEARAAGLVRPSSPWEKWRKRMLKHRAMSFALRDAFPDILSGTYSYEEMDSERFAANQDLEMRILDDVEASILEDKQVPTETPPVKAGNKLTKNTTTTNAAKKR
jgi:hypothetical protein